jgi:2-polyprenyl-6-methoxyphenol hydroxylase-like FAD-dependent oxidoreductase
VGADGTRSPTRCALGIGLVPQGPPTSYFFFDVPYDNSGDTAQLSLSGGSDAAVYPLQGNHARVTFQVSVASALPPSATQLEQLLHARLPFLTAAPGSFEWSGNADFRPALAERFGDGRVWLVGDAAHSTSPLGGQSMNVGVFEGDDLAQRISRCLEGRNHGFGAGYEQQRRVEWHRLFGLAPSQPDLSHASDWVRRHFKELLPALPASGDELDDLLDQLKVRSA